MAALDFFSASFDPLLALNTPGLRPPILDVKPLISVQMCRSLLPDEHKDYKPPKPATQHADEQHGDSAATNRRIAATQPVVHTQRAVVSDPLTLFATAARIPRPLSKAVSSSPSLSAVGPLSLLQSLIATQQRCRVLLRSHHSLHSIVTGQLRAFDRHCNLYIAEAQQTHRTTAQLTVSERQRRKGHKADSDVAGSGRRWEWVEVERQVGVWQREWVGQMLVRGECVISVSRCTEASEAADSQIKGIEPEGDC